MLKNLKVHNFAIIEDIFIDFKKGMTVLTGETGAGKSLIIDTISLLLGQRADTDMIRYGESKATITGVFSYMNPKIDALLERFSIPKREDITIHREIHENSKNLIQVNSYSVTLIMLKQISALLADVHIQNDTYRLFNPESYLEIINPKHDEAYDALLESYTLSYAKYLERYKVYEHIVKGQKESSSRLEYLEYEKEELKSLGLSKDLDVSLTSEISKLENYDKIYTNLNEAYQALENEYFTIDQIYIASEYLKKVEHLDVEYKKASEKLLDSYYVVDEVKQALSMQIRNLDFNQEELNQKLEQLHAIEKAKAKYKMNLDELISYLEKITLEIDMVQNYDTLLKTAKQALEDSFSTLVQSANKLTAYRKKIASKIETGILAECKALDLEETRFSIQFSKKEIEDPLKKEIFSDTGIDGIEFMISFNSGEPLRPLHKIASGGEMSRIMLAFKAYFSIESALSLMVFDEIDTGVSGATAKKIAKKIKEISLHNQVLCITHLPQVASMGDHHIHIYKALKNQRTTTHFKYLETEERIKEIALMLSGDKMSLYALEHAKALLENKD